MKKTIGLFIGVVALLVAVVPALATYYQPQKSEPSTLTNMVMITNESAALANTGMNRLEGSGVLKTGAANSESVNYNAVNVSVVGCCEEDDSDCCNHYRDRRCGCGQTQEPSTRVMNMVMLMNSTTAMSNTGLNVLTAGSQQKPSCRTHHYQPVATSSLTTGAAEAVSGNTSLVNLSVTGF